MNARFMSVVCALALSVALSNCSESPSNPATSQSPQVQMMSEFSSTTVTASATQKDESGILANGEVADSLHITRARILVSRLKLHRANDESETCDKDLKLGPFLITIDSAGQRVVAMDTIPEGNYDKVKFEIHRFSNSEISLYLDDLLYMDFVTNDRYTVLVEGTVYKDGKAYPFTYRSNVTANITLDFDGLFTISSQGLTTLILQMNPVLSFRYGSQVLDPRDPRNKSHVENALRASLRVYKRH